jgi:XTP/dITP diphosphohydrolase
MPKLLIATTNPGKIREITSLLEGLPYEVIGLNLLPERYDVVEETGSTFTENAIIKSEYYFAQTGILSLADDSGLEVDALDGAPGIYSARFAGERATDADRVQKILSELHGVPRENRGAQFVCSIAITGFEDGTKTFEGIARGEISESPLGENGFGYDPIFIDPVSRKTYAELSKAEKSLSSHRGKSLMLAREFLISRLI